MRNFLGFDTDSSRSYANLFCKKLFLVVLFFPNAERIAGTKRGRQARGFVSHRRLDIRLLTPTLSSFGEAREVICWTIYPERRSVLPHGHCSLCPGLLSVGRSALQFGTRIACPSNSVRGPLLAEAEKGAAFQPRFDVPTVSPPPPCRSSTRKWACRGCGRYCGPRELSGAVRGQPQP